MYVLTKTLKLFGKSGLLFFILILTSGKVSAQTIVFENPIKYSNVNALLVGIMANLETIVGAIAVLMIVIGGIMYMLSAGDSNAAERAKKIIMAAVIGLAIVLSARTFLQEIWNILGQSSQVESPGGSSISAIITRTLNLLLSIVGVLAIISLVIGGAMYLTSYGNDDQITRGKNIITASIIGIVIVLSAVIIIRQIDALI